MKLPIPSPALAILVCMAALLTRDATPGAESPAAADRLFTADRLPTFRIEVPEADVSQLRSGNVEYVRSRVWVDGRALADVGVRLKGRGSFRPVADKASFALKFNEFSPRQTFRGLTKILLNNSSQDSTCLSEYVATGLFRDAGVPAGRVTHARVEFNGRDLGFDVLAEAMNRPFLKQHFHDPDGNLYEGVETSCRHQRGGSERFWGIPPDLRHQRDSTAGDSRRLDTHEPQLRRQDDGRRRICLRASRARLRSAV